MKKFIQTFVFIVGISTYALSQTAMTDSLKKHYLNVYRQSIAYNDARVAINALHGYVALDNGAQGFAYKDTLSILYFATKSYYPALLLSQEILKQQPDNVNALARSAECFQNLGDAKSAVTAFEQVCQKVKNPYYNYQLALVQYELKRIAECENNLKIVVADSNSNRIAVAFTLPNGAVQEVPANAAALNILGILQMDAKNLEMAKKYFEESLKKYPDFIGAQQNLQVLANINKKPATPTGNKNKGKS